MSQSSVSNPFKGRSPIGNYFAEHRPAFGLVSSEVIEACLEPLELEKVPKNFSEMLEMLEGEDKMEPDEFKKHIVLKCLNLY